MKTFKKGQKVTVIPQEKWAFSLTLPMARDMISAKMQGKVVLVGITGSKSTPYVKVSFGGKYVWMFAPEALK